jgi:hypothetical protein
MKKHIFFLSFLLLLMISGRAYSQCGTLLDVCHGRLENARFLRSWPIQLPHSKPGEQIQQVSYKMALSSGTTYKIFACNANEFPGKVIISIRNHNDDLVITSYLIEQKRHLPIILFPVAMSGMYTFSFYFEDGLEGCAVGVVSSVN